MTLRPRPGVVADIATVLGTFAVLGVLGGVLWWLLVDPVQLTKGADGAGAMDELTLSRRFATDGWYSVIAIVGGFLGGLGVTAWRSRDYRVTTLLLLAGAAVAAYAMSVVGGALGPEDPETALAAAEVGGTVPLALEVSAFSVYLLWPIAALAGALMVLWSSPTSPETDGRVGASRADLHKP